MSRRVKHYQRPTVVEEHLHQSQNLAGIGFVSDNEMYHAYGERYQACAALLDTLMYDLFKTTEKYHVVTDMHGPLYHVEVVDFIAKLETIMEKVSK